MGFSRDIESGKQSAEGGLSIDDATSSIFRQLVKTLGAATSLWRGLARPGGEEAFALQPLQSCVECARRGFPASARLNFVADADPVSRVAQAHNCEKYYLFKLTE
jgi:hypothetical protein